MDEIGFFRCFVCSHGREAMLLGQLPVVRSLQFRYDGVQTAVPEVLRLGMTLTSISQYCKGFPLQ